MNAAHDTTMSFGDHLEELRTRLIHTLIGLGIATAVALFFGQSLVVWLCVPLLNVYRFAGLPLQLINTEVTTGFSVYLKVSLLAGLVVSSPWVIFQVWKFVAPGLYASERKIIYTLAPLSAGMAAIAVVFMYWVMLPICLAFMIFFSTSYPSPPITSSPWMDTLTGLTARSVQIEAPGGDAAQGVTTPDAEALAGLGDVVSRLPLLVEDPEQPSEGQAWIKLPERELRVAVGGQVLVFAGQARDITVRPLMNLPDYISFVCALTLGCLIAYQLPVLMLVLGWTGALDPRWLGKYALVCCLAAGMLLTPADPLSMLALAIPLYLIFEFGLLLMRWTEGKPDAE